MLRILVLAVALGLFAVPAGGADWNALSPEARQRVARVFGHQGPLRDGLFDGHLDGTPDLRRAFQRLHGPALPVEPPPVGDWAALSGDQRRAVALLYGYDGPVRDGLFARYLQTRPALAADQRLRHPPGVPPAPEAAGPSSYTGGWAALTPAQRREVARAFGYDRPPADGPPPEEGFARALDTQPDLRRAFQRLYGPALPVEPPPVGDWAAFSDEQRRAVALLYGYDGPVRGNLFARHLQTRPLLAADVRHRYQPNAAGPAPEPNAAFHPPRRRADWNALSPEERQRVARAFGYDGDRAAVAGSPLWEASFAWHLDRTPDLRRAFQRIYGPEPPVEPPAVGDWTTLSGDQRRAVALLYGYDGPVRDGLFARYLETRPALAADQRLRHLPGAAAPPPPEPPYAGPFAALTPAQRREVAAAFGYDRPPADGPSPEEGFARHLDSRPDLRRAFQRRFGPALPVEPPAVADWTTLSGDQRRAVALLYGYDGPVRDGLFARHLQTRPALEADHRQRYLPAAPPVPGVPAAPAPPPPPLPTASPKPPPSAPPRPAPPPAVTERPAPPAGAQHRTGSFLSAGSFKVAANAEVLVPRIARLGYPAEVVEWRDGKGETWRVVRVGPFPSPADARAAAGRLTAAGIPTAPLARP